MFFFAYIFLIYSYMYVIIWTKASWCVVVGRCFSEVKGVFWKNWAAVQVVIFTIVGATMFSISLVRAAWWLAIEIVPRFSTIIPRQLT